jgi:endonuclease/exonuclease/phosphatase family metal-dependent hydrolase
MAEPFCALWSLGYRVAAPDDLGKFENCRERTEEAANRVLAISAILLSCALLGLFPLPVLSIVVVVREGSKLLRAIGFALQKGGYNYIRGEAAEKAIDPSSPKVKVMTFNVCGPGGGMSLDHGGVIPWQKRLDALVEKIRAEDPDVLLLQEIYDRALLEALVERLKVEYAHFFTDLGPNVMGSVGGLMVISKCPVHRFSHTSFKNNKWTLNRGFGTLEIKARAEDTASCLRIINTHLIHGNEEQDKKSRMEQVAQLVQEVADRRLIPTVVGADFNIERDEKSLSFLDHAYLGREPTCTNRLVEQWNRVVKIPRDEIIDNISLIRDTNLHGAVSFEDCHLVKSFDESYDTSKALSDHHGVTATIKFSNEYH